MNQDKIQIVYCILFLFVSLVESSAYVIDSDIFVDETESVALIIGHLELLPRRHSVEQTSNFS